MGPFRAIFPASGYSPFFPPLGGQEALAPFAAATERQRWAFFRVVCNSFLALSEVFVFKAISGLYRLTVYPGY